MQLNGIYGGFYTNAIQHFFANVGSGIYFRQYFVCYFSATGRGQLSRYFYDYTNSINYGDKHGTSPDSQHLAYTHTKGHYTPVAIFL